MTSPVDCPQPDNMAAIALQMQETAMQAEAALYEIELGFAAALNRPTWVIDQTTTATGIAANQEVNLLQAGATYVEQFNNTGRPVFLGSQFEVPYAGIWQCGFSANMTASGAVNDNTHRTFRLIHGRPASQTVLGFETIWDEQSTLMETNTGIGTDGVVVADFNMLPGDWVLIFLNHGNTSSTINVPAPPNPRFWGTLISTRDQVKVVA